VTPTVVAVVVVLLKVLADDVTVDTRGVTVTVEVAFKVSVAAFGEVIFSSTASVTDPGSFPVF
jgi:hypothetical protein